MTNPKAKLATEIEKNLSILNSMYDDCSDSEIVKQEEKINTLYETYNAIFGEYYTSLEERQEMKSEQYEEVTDYSYNDMQNFSITDFQ